MKRIGTWLKFAVLLAGTYLPALAYADRLRIEQDHPSISYTGAWETYNGASLSGGSLTATRQEGATVSVPFTGTGISWLSYQSSTTRGTTRIYLDGVLIGGTGPIVGVIDFYVAKQWKFGIAGLAHGNHVLKIEVTSEFPGNYTTIAVDAFDIETGAVTQLREENDISVTYTGTWMDIDDPSVSGGSVLASREAGASATVHFRGTGISWIGYRCACADGRVTVTLDGNPVGTLYTPVNATERHAQSLMLNRTGLTDGEHQLRIEVEDDAIGANNAPWVVIDAFRVQTGTTDGPDTTPPQVTLRAPTEGTVFGRHRLIADAFDNVGVTSLRYYVDDIEFTPEGTLATSGLINLWFNPAFSPRGLSNGAHALTAVARDAAGNEKRSAPVNVIIDITPPTVTLTSPSHNAQVTGVVTLSATATGDRSSTGVGFFARSSDGTVTDLGWDYDAPYALERNTSGIPSGRTFTLWAQVYDAGGIPVNSPEIQVTVQH